MSFPGAETQSFAGRRVVITGASRGFGRALAERFHGLGATLLLLARNTVDLRAVAESLSDVRVSTAACDLNDPDAAARILTGDWGAPDILINNAGIQGRIGPFAASDSADWEQVLRVNLLAPVALCRACLPGMIARSRGRIINLSGGGATGPRPGFSAYAVAKTGLVRFTETVAAEVRDHGVTLNAIAPGAMPTAMMREIVVAGPAAGPREVEIAEKVLAEGDRVILRAVDLCVFLASDAGAGVSGKLLAAMWDPWDRLGDRTADLSGDVYTLRRIVPKDRGMNWGDI